MRTQSLIKANFSRQTRLIQQRQRPEGRPESSSRSSASSSTRKQQAETMKPNEVRRIIVLSLILLFLDRTSGADSDSRATTPPSSGAPARPERGRLARQPDDASPPDDEQPEEPAGALGEGLNEAKRVARNVNTRLQLVNNRMSQLESLISADHPTSARLRDAGPPTTTYNVGATSLEPSTPELASPADSSPEGANEAQAAESADQEQSHTHTEDQRPISGASPGDRGDGRASNEKAGQLSAAQTRDPASSSRRPDAIRPVITNSNGRQEASNQTDAARYASGALLESPSQAHNSILQADEAWNPSHNFFRELNERNHNQRANQHSGRQASAPNLDRFQNMTVVSSESDLAKSYSHSEPTSVRPSLAAAPVARASSAASSRPSQSSYSAFAYAKQSQPAATTITVAAQPLGPATKSRPHPSMDSQQDSNPSSMASSKTNHWDANRLKLKNLVPGPIQDNAQSASHRFFTASYSSADSPNLASNEDSALYANLQPDGSPSPTKSMDHRSDAHGGALDTMDLGQNRNSYQSDAGASYGATSQPVPQDQSLFDQQSNVSQGDSQPGSATSTNGLAGADQYGEQTASNYSQQLAGYNSASGAGDLAPSEGTTSQRMNEPESRPSYASGGLSNRRDFSSVAPQDQLAPGDEVNAGRAPAVGRVASTQQQEDYYSSGYLAELQRARNQEQLLTRVKELQLQQQRELLGQANFIANSNRRQWDQAPGPATSQQQAQFQQQAPAIGYYNLGAQSQAPARQQHHSTHVSNQDLSSMYASLTQPALKFSARPAHNVYSIFGSAAESNTTPSLLDQMNSSPFRQAAYQSVARHQSPLSSFSPDVGSSSNQRVSHSLDSNSQAAAGAQLAPAAYHYEPSIGGQLYNLAKANAASHANPSAGYQTTAISNYPASSSSMFNSMAAATMQPATYYEPPPSGAQSASAGYPASSSVSKSLQQQQPAALDPAAEASSSLAPSASSSASGSLAGDSRRRSFGFFKPTASSRYYYAPTLLSPIALASPSTVSSYYAAPSYASSALPSADSLPAVGSTVYSTPNGATYVLASPSSSGDQLRQYQIALAQAAALPATHYMASADPDMSESSLVPVAPAESAPYGSVALAEPSVGSSAGPSSEQGAADSLGAASANMNSVKSSSAKGMIPWTNIAGLLLGILPFGILMATLLPVVTVAGRKKRELVEFGPRNFSDLMSWRPRSRILNSLLGNELAMLPLNGPAARFNATSPSSILSELLGLVDKSAPASQQATSEPAARLQAAHSAPEQGAAPSQPLSSSVPSNQPTRSPIAGQPLDSSVLSRIRKKTRSLLTNFLMGSSPSTSNLKLKHRSSSANLDEHPALGLARNAAHLSVALGRLVANNQNQQAARAQTRASASQKANHQLASSPPTTSSTTTTTSTSTTTTPPPGTMSEDAREKGAARAKATSGDTRGQSGAGLAPTAIASKVENNTIDIPASKSAHKECERARLNSCLKQFLCQLIPRLHENVRNLSAKGTQETQLEFVTKSQLLNLVTSIENQNNIFSLTDDPPAADETPNGSLEQFHYSLDGSAASTTHKQTRESLIESLYRGAIGNRCLSSWQCLEVTKFHEFVSKMKLGSKSRGS